MADIDTSDRGPGPLRMPPGLGENPPGGPLPIGPLIRSLATRLDEAGVPWAVLRNAEGLPDYTRYDIDILTLPRHRAELLHAIENCARDHDWQIVGRIRKRHYICLMLCRMPADPDCDEPFYLPIDIFSALEFRGLQYFGAAGILKQRIRTANGIWTLPPGIDAAITLFKEWLPHGVLKQNSCAAVQTRIAADPEAFRHAMMDAAGMGLGGRLADLVEREEWRLPPETIRSLRRGLRRRQPTWPLAYAHALLSNLVHGFRPSLGMLVYLAGADGSGKTTLARGLLTQTYRRPFKACRYLHGNAVVLPRFRDMRARLRRLAGRAPAVTANNDPSGDMPLKGMMDPVAPWKSVALAAYYTLDLMLARWPFRRWRGQWTLIVMDRSFYDFHYQLGHRRCPHWILAILSYLIPKPDFLFCIEGDPEKIHARKPELTVAEIQREQVLLRRLSQGLPFARCIDGTLGPEVMIETASKTIESHLCRR